MNISDLRKEISVLRGKRLRAESGIALGYLGY